MSRAEISPPLFHAAEFSQFMPNRSRRRNSLLQVVGGHGFLRGLQDNGGIVAGSSRVMPIRDVRCPAIGAEVRRRSHNSQLAPLWLRFCQKVQYEPKPELFWL